MERVSPQFIIQGLIQRGYPPHVAQGFVMNMMDESGLRPGINEAAPIVPGSRGGFGLYQLTGPRRTAYEQFAAQRGVNPADVDAQLDFLDYEMRGPESRAAKSILSTRNPQEAAVAIARDFLRPASEHLQNRVARYSGADVAADTMAALGKGGGAVTPDQIAQSAQAQSTGMQDEQRPRGLLGGLFGNPDTMANLALAFNSMRLNPDPNLGAVLTAQMRERRESQRKQDELNKTIAFFDELGDPVLRKLAQVNPSAAFSMYQRKVAADRDPNVQSSQMLRDFSGTILTMRDGSTKVLTSGGQELTGQEAMDFIKTSEANYTQSQRDIYGARREGTLTSEIELGGEAERVKAEGKDAPRIAAENLKDAGVVRSSISNIDNAISAIDQGAQSGVVYNMLPDITLASASLTNAMNRLGLDVIGSVTFGALSEGELRLAMETAVPRNLPPAELRQWLVRHKQAQEKAYLALIETAQHFAGGGSMADYLDKIKANGASSSPSGAASQPQSPPVQRRKFDASGNPVGN